MKEIKSLLDYVRKTNPEITEKKLLEELSKCRYAAIALSITAGARQKIESL